jgi:hypothetical protein
MGKNIQMIYACMKNPHHVIKEKYYMNTTTCVLYIQNITTYLYLYKNRQ